MRSAVLLGLLFATVLVAVTSASSVQEEEEPRLSISIDALKNVAGGLFGSLGKKVDQLKSGLLGGLKDKVENAKTDLLTGLKKKIDGVKDLLGNLKDILSGDNKRDVHVINPDIVSRRDLTFESLGQKLDSLIKMIEKYRKEHFNIFGKRDLDLTFEGLGNKLDKIVELLNNYAKEHLNFLGKRDSDDDLTPRGIFEELGNKLDKIVQKVDGYIKDNTILGKRDVQPFRLHTVDELKKSLKDLQMIKEKIEELFKEEALNL